MEFCLQAAFDVGKWRIGICGCIRQPENAVLPFSKHIQHSARNKKAAENIDARQ